MASKSTIDQLKAKLKELLQNGSVKMSVYFGLLDLLDSGQDLLFVSEAMKTIDDAEAQEAAKTAAKQAKPSSGSMTQAEYDAAKKAKYQEYKTGKITNYAYIQWKKKNDPALNPAPAAPAAPAGLTQAEYEVLKKQKYADYKAGKITNYAYIQWKKKNDPSLNGGAASASAAKSTATTAPDPGQAAADKAVAEVEKRLRKTYKQAYNEITQKMTEWSKAFADKDSEMQGKVASGEITQAQYDSWLQGQVLAGDLWQKKLDQVSGVLLEANQQAMEIVNGQKMGVFAENANYQSYQLTQDTKLDLSFAVYDVDAVAKLIKDRPELLPRKQVNGKKDKAWNQNKMANIAAQAIIQGESIPQIARRIATETASDNMKAMVRYARTAMTSAQNAGRMETLHRAKGMGIQCKKVWLATLDRRTRDSHRNLDGQVRDIDEPFDSDFGKIMFPGDPEGHPGDVYNCRCTLTYQYEDYPVDPSTNDRLMYEEWDEEVPVKKKDKNGKEYETKKIIHHRESKLVTDVTYNEWAAVKQADKINSLNFAKVTLAEAQKAVIKHKIKEDKVYSDLWKDDVTLADYPAKAASIDAKRDYYTAEIEKLNNAIANGQSWAKPEKVKELEKKRKLLNEFELNGQILQKRNEALKALQDLYDQVGYQKTATAPVVPGALKKPAKKASTGAAAGGGTSGQAAATAGSAGQAAAKSGQFAANAWDAKTKKAAKYYDHKDDADKVLRPELDALWDNLTETQKYAVWEYTANSNPMNKRLSGYADTKKWERKDFVGFGNTVWGLEDTWRYLPSGMEKFGENGHSKYHKAITELTKAIEKSTLGRDMWFKRQGGPGDFAGMMEGGGFKFEQIFNLLDGKHSQAELDAALVGQRGKNNAFTSVGIAKDAMWSGNIWYNIYAPKGTKGIYAEPQSHYGQSMGRKDVIYKKGSSYSGIGSEAEVIMQRGTEYRILAIRQKKDRWGDPEYEVDMEIVAQPDYFAHGDEDTYNDGKTRHKK